MENPHGDLNLLHKESLEKNFQILANQILKNEMRLMSGPMTPDDMGALYDRQMKLQNAQNWTIALLRTYFPPSIVVPPGSSNGKLFIPPQN